MKNSILLFAALLPTLSLATPAVDPPLACNLGTLTSTERENHDALTRKLFAAAAGRRDTADGYAFILDRNRISLADLGTWIGLERRCCSFFDFRLDVSRGEGPLTLTLGGPEGVRQFIASGLAEQQTPVLASPAGQKQPIADAIDTWVTRIEEIVVPAAEAMPEARYTFAPTAGEFAGVRTFAEQVKHLAAANYLLGARALGERPPHGESDEAAPESVRSRADVIDYVKGSFAYLHKAARSINESNAAVRIGPIVDALAHSSNHYGQMVEYLRMNGIVPPASR